MGKSSIIISWCPRLLWWAGHLEGLPVEGQWPSHPHWDLSPHFRLLKLLWRPSHHLITHFHPQVLTLCILFAGHFTDSGFLSTNCRRAVHYRGSQPVILTDPTTDRSFILYNYNTLEDEKHHIPKSICISFNFFLGVNP